MERVNHTLTPKVLKKELLEIEIIPYLESLRAILVDIVQAYMGRLDSRLVNLLDFLRGEGEGGAQKRIKKSKIKDLRKTLDGLEVKPYKGRRGDIKRIERLVEKIEGICEF